MNTGMKKKLFQSFFAVSPHNLFLDVGNFQQEVKRVQSPGVSPRAHALTTRPSKWFTLHADIG